MAAQVAGRRRHLLAGCARSYCCAASSRAKRLRILICSLQTDNSELPMHRLWPPSRGYLQWLLAVFAKAAWSLWLNCAKWEPWRLMLARMHRFKRQVG